MRSKIAVVFATIIFILVLVGLGFAVFLGKSQVKSTPIKSPEPVKTYTLTEVARHSSRGDCWAVISNQVYNITNYIGRHPGGDEILRACGQDATTLFLERQTKDGKPVGTGGPHSQIANEQLKTLKIGNLAQ